MISFDHLLPFVFLPCIRTWLHRRWKNSALTSGFNVCSAALWPKSRGLFCFLDLDSAFRNFSFFPRSSVTICPVRGVKIFRFLPRRTGVAPAHTKAQYLISPEEFYVSFLGSHYHCFCLTGLKYYTELPFKRVLGIQSVCSAQRSWREIGSISIKKLLKNIAKNALNLRSVNNQENPQY